MRSRWGLRSMSAIANSGAATLTDATSTRRALLRRRPSVDRTAPTFRGSGPISLSRRQRSHQLPPTTVTQAGWRWSVHSQRVPVDHLPSTRLATKRQQPRPSSRNAVGTQTIASGHGIIRGWAVDYDRTPSLRGRLWLFPRSDRNRAHRLHVVGRNTNPQTGRHRCDGFCGLARLAAWRRALPSLS